jgi:hypothetical protein
MAEWPYIKIYFFKTIRVFSFQVEEPGGKAGMCAEE